MLNNLFILDKNKNIVDILSNNGTSPRSPFFNDKYIQYLDTGAETFEFSTLANERTNKYCQVGSYIAFNYQGHKKLFQITETEETHEDGSIVKNCYCEIIGIELSNYIVRPLEMHSVNIKQFLEAILSDTSWKVGYIDSSIVNVLSIKLDKPTSVYSLIQEYIPDFGCEVEFKTEMTHNKVSGQYVNIYKKRGSETFKRFEFSKNVSNVTRQMDMSQVVTSMIGIGKNGLTFKDAEWTSKDPAIKPLNQDFVVNTAAYESWNKQGEHIVGVYENNEVESAYELLRLTWEELKKVSDPKFTYEVETTMIQSDEEEVSIGDTVYVIDHEYDPPLYLEARVGELILSFTDHTQNQCTLTNYREVKSKIKDLNLNGIINEIQDLLKNLEVGIIDQATINKLKDYLVQLGLSKEEIKTIFDKVVNNDFLQTLPGPIQNITLQNNRFYSLETLSYLSLKAPETIEENFSTTVSFKTGSNCYPLKYSQDNNIWMEGTDCIKGVLLPKAAKKYQITIKKGGTNRSYLGTVSVLSSEAGSYLKVDQYPGANKIIEKGLSYFNNNPKFRYKTRTPMTFATGYSAGVWGNRNKWYEDLGDGEGSLFNIDCSTFTNLSCKGWDFEKSIYNVNMDINLENPEVSHTIKLPRNASQQFEYCLENGWLVTDGSYKKGDLVFWSRAGSSTADTVNKRFGQISHVALIEKVENEIPYTIEVTSGLETVVVRRPLSQNQPEKIVAHFRPRYEGETYHGKENINE